MGFSKQQRMAEAPSSVAQKREPFESASNLQGMNATAETATRRHQHTGGNASQPRTPHPQRITQQGVLVTCSTSRGLPCQTRYTHQITVTHKGMLPAGRLAGCLPACGWCALQHTQNTPPGWNGSQLPEPNPHTYTYNPWGHCCCCRQSHPPPPIPPHEMPAAVLKLSTTQHDQHNDTLVPLAECLHTHTCKQPCGVTPCTHRCTQALVPPPTEPQTPCTASVLLAGSTPGACLAAAPSQLHTLHQHSQLQVL